MNLMPPRISRYETKGLIAQGGMGDLYLALDPNTSRLVAIKLLNATLDSTDARTRFEREARALASLNHPNIVHIYDYGEFKGAPFIVMEYVRGETIAELIKRQAPLPVAKKLKLMTELCAGLAQAHEAGIVHRDVKPANLVVDQDERLKILDFGIARIAESSLTRMPSQLTQLNVQIGTPGYMSPEQIDGGEIDHRTDIFAAGAVCYELLSYREAFSGANTREIERNVLQARPVLPASLLPGLDPEIETIVTRALAKDRTQRYQSAAKLGEALERCRVRLDSAETPTMSQTLPPQDLGPRSNASRGEAAYQRSLAAYQQGSHDAARRFAIEALAEDPNHAGARTLLARLEPARPPAAPPPVRPPTPAPPVAPRYAASPRVPSAPDPPTVFPEFTAPTVVIPRANRPLVPAHVDETFISSRADWPAGPSPIDETVLITRKDRPARVPPSNPPVASARTDRPVAGARPDRLAPSRGKPEGLRASLQPLLTGWRDLWKRRQPARKSYEPRRKAGGGLWSQYGRSALIAVGLIVLAAGTLLLAIRLSGWIWPPGQLLTITKPEGGTISAAGIRCGTRGSDCSTTHPDGDPIELEVDPDEGFAFSGFTGDCAPTGRTAMIGPRTCGATFELLKDGVTATVWPLTIVPPKGGTILAAGGIECGTLRSLCAANLPDGVPVTLHAMPDEGFTLLHFTEECAPSGQTMMTGPRTCSATFTPSAVAVQQTSPPPTTTPRPTRQPTVVIDPPPTVGGPSSPPVQPPPVPPVTTELPQTPAKPDAEPPITAEAHAKKEIPGIFKEYCAALEALSVPKLQKVYPTVNVRSHQEQFRQYKTLKCTVTPPEFVELDAVVGTAKVEVSVKQTIEMKSGGAPKTSETIATTALVRPEERSFWLISSMNHKPKPKE